MRKLYLLDLFNSSMLFNKPSASLLKLSFIMMLIGVIVNKGECQLVKESFSYPPHITSGLASQSGGVWTVANSGDSILIESGSLIYQGLENSTGNKVVFGGAGADYFRPFTLQNSGNIYSSFLLNISSLGSLNTTGGYAIGFADGSTNFGSTVWFRSNGSNFNIGLNTRTTAVNTQWLPILLNVNQTYLIVISYEFIPSTGNDVVKLWINPTSLGFNEPTADVSSINTAGTDLNNIQRIFLRQDAATTTPGVMLVDEMRVGNTWASVTPTVPTSPIISISTGNNAAEPSTNGNFTINFSEPTTVSTNINYAFTGTALFGSDYNISYSAGTTTSTSSTGTLSVPAGTSSITVSVNTVDDLEFEVTESVTLTLSNPAEGYILGTATATINIIDNDAPPTVSVSAGTHAAEPSKSGTFNINLSAPAPPGGVTVSYTFSGSATLGTDYNDLQNGNIIIPEGTSAGTITITVTDDDILEGPETIDINLTNVTNGFTLGTSTATINLIDNEIAPVPKIVINEVYGGGGNSGATYKNDFIELYNNENYAVNLNGWSVQYASATGTSSWSFTSLTGTIPAKGYYLIQQAGTTSTSFSSLPTPDATGTLNMSATAGKVALVNNTTALFGACSTLVYVDLVGFGSTANCFEGSGPTTAPSNSASVQRKIKGFDSNDNKEDFETITSPTPRNSVADITPPVIVSTYPENNATELSTSFTASITFSENVTKGSGNIVLKDAAGSVINTYDVNSSDDVRVSGSLVYINIQGLPYNSSFYFEITPGAFLDASDNEFSGITDGTTWSFSTATVAPVGNINSTYTFNECTTSLTNGFMQYSEEGSVIWGCTTFGRDANNPPSGSAPNGLQINGFVNGANQINTDWLISPAFDLTNTNYPILSFWSRNAFTGAPLKLVVSTDYAGWGDPNLATWTELNGKFPGTASDVWTLSDNINLTKYKGTAVYVAFIYSSSSDDGARWTLDDITIRNDNNPPAPSLTVLATDVQFIYVKGGETAAKEISFVGNDLVENVIVTATSGFYVSKDGENFATSVTYNAADANDVFSKLYIQFAPGAENQSYSGTVSLSTSEAIATINVIGSSIDPAITLEVVNWNIEWFGSAANGPRNEELQEQNVVKIMKEVNADVYGLMEIVDEAKLARVVAQLDGYEYVISNYGSHTNTSRNPPSALAEAQKLAFVYKTNVIKNINTRALLSQGINTAEDANHPYYYYWSSGRFPYMMDADVTLGDVTKNVKFLLVHAKANTAPLNTSYDRRKAGADALYDSLKILWPNQEIIMFGDFNDDLDQSITTGYTTTSWNKFTEDGQEYDAVTLPLSLAGKKSTVSYNDIIDHVVVSNEMQRWYMTSTANILTEVTGLVSNYGSTTSDHYPVFSRYIYCNITAPENIVVSNDEGKCGAVVNYSFNNTQTCGTVTANIPSGSFFETGTHTVTLSSSYGDVATFTVTVNDNEKPVITHNGIKNLNNDAGKCGASVTVSATATDNCSIELTVTGSRNDELALDADYPVGTTTITWTITDASGNTETAEQTVVVTDNENPVITAPATVTTIPNASSCVAINVNLGDPDTSDNCGILSVTNNKPASFAVGTTVVTWTVTDVNGNSSIATQNVVVRVDPAITSSIPDAYAITPGGAVNTVYIGYAPASSITLNAQVSGGTSPYSYKWTVGSSSGRGFANTSSITVRPTASSTTYFLNTADKYDCEVNAATITIYAVDVRCGPKNDRVSICQSIKGKWTTSCVASKDVPSLLAAGATLGSCSSTPSSVTINEPLFEQNMKGFDVLALPNPSSGYFNIRIQSLNSSERIFIRVSDILGRTIDQFQNIPSNHVLRIGDHYKNGVYLVEVIQGSTKKHVKIIKNQ